jgi:hypothetical protein
LEKFDRIQPSSLGFGIGAFPALLRCLFISSVVPVEFLPPDFVLETAPPSFSQTGLNRRSVLRSHKLALLHKSLVLRVLGETDQAFIREINSRLRVALGL